MIAHDFFVDRQSIINVLRDNLYNLFGEDDSKIEKLCPEACRNEDKLLEYFAISLNFSCLLLTTIQATIYEFEVKNRNQVKFTKEKVEESAVEASRS